VLTALIFSKDKAENITAKLLGMRYQLPQQLTQNQTDKNTLDNHATTLECLLAAKMRCCQFIYWSAVVSDISRVSFIQVARICGVGRIMLSSFPSCD